MENIEKLYLTAEELDQIKIIRQAGANLSSQFGEIEYRIQLLTLQKTDLITKLNELKQEEIRFGDMLDTKYGNGSINLETGEFIKS